MSSRSVTTGRRAAYLAFASYLKALPSQPATDAYATFRGRLEWTTNPFVSSPVWNNATTGGGPRYTWGAAYPKPTFNGTTHALARNTWFRWVKDSDQFTTKDVTDGTIKITVLPTITVAKATSSGRVRVSGTVARTGGTAVLQRNSGGSWSTITQVKITSDGKYSFGYRFLSGGSYRVVSLATQSWGSNTKGFSI
jgi:hypothetical protein